MVLQTIVGGSQRPRNVGSDEMSVEEFQKWLDINKDGKISEKELREAIRANGGWFSRIRAKQGIWSADKNANGVIDENEIANLVQWAKKNFGVKIV